MTDWQREAERLGAENLSLEKALERSRNEVVALFDKCLALQVALTEIRDLVANVDQQYSSEAAVLDDTGKTEQDDGQE